MPFLQFPFKNCIHAILHILRLEVLLTQSLHRSINCILVLLGVFGFYLPEVGNDLSINAIGALWIFAHRVETIEAKPFIILFEHSGYFSISLN